MALVILSLLEAQLKFAPYFLDDAVINGFGECDLGALDGLTETLVVLPLLCKVGHQSVEQGILTEVHVASGNPVVPVIQAHFFIECHQKPNFCISWLKPYK